MHLESQPSPKKRTTVRPVPWQLRALQGGMGLLDSVSPDLAGRAAEVIFRTPRRYPQPRRERRWLADAWERDLLVNDKKIRAWSWGEGPTVLLAHGWEGRGGQMAGFAHPLVEAGFRVITFDGPAHGLSEGRRTSLPGWGRVIHELAAVLGPLEAIVAHSFGAATTSWALRLGTRVRRLVFVSPPKDFDDYIGTFRRMLHISPAATDRMVRGLETRYGFDWQDVRRSTLDAADETPMLVIHDPDDDEVEYVAGRTVAETWPQGRLYTTAGLGHRRILRAPEVIREVVDFLAGDRLLLEH